jgi:hypothetical protein
MSLLQASSVLVFPLPHLTVQHTRAAEKKLIPSFICPPRFMAVTTLQENGVLEGPGALVTSQHREELGASLDKRDMYRENTSCPGEGECGAYPSYQWSSSVLGRRTKGTRL